MRIPRLPFLALVFAAAMAASGLGGALHRAIEHTPLAHGVDPGHAVEHASHHHGCCNVPKPAAPTHEGDREQTPKPESPSHDCDFCAVLAVLASSMPDDGGEAIIFAEASVSLLFGATHALYARPIEREASPRGPPLRP